MKFKNETASVEVKGTAIKFDKKDFKAVKGTKGSRFEGEIKILPNNVADKLISLKKATEEKSVEIEVSKREQESVKQVS